MGMSMVDVTCIGQALVDCITRLNDQEQTSGRVHRARSISLSIGGDAVNESMVLSRLGHRVRLVCGVGDDIAGRLILSQMQDEGVDVSGVDARRDIVTPIANLMISEDGSRQSYNSDATMLGSYAPEVDVTAGSRIVSFASLFRAPLDRVDIVKKLIVSAKDHGAIICADTKMPTFRRMDLSKLRDVLPLIDYIFPNDAEAAFYSGRRDIREAAAFFRACGVKNVIVKAGKDGCFVSGENDSFHMKALLVQAVDSTGAGDNFVAGFISALLRGFNLYECCRYGTVCAAACVENTGAAGGVKTREEADRIYYRCYYS